MSLYRKNIIYGAISVTNPPASTSMPYDWLKQIPTALLQLDEIPLIGFPLPFPWKELSQGMREVFEIPDFNFEPGPFQWRVQEELLSGLGPDVSSLVGTIPSLEGQFYWLMASEDVHRFMSLLLNEEHHEHDVLDPEFLQGFYYFTAYEVIHLLTKLPFGSSLSPQILKDGSLPNEASLCADLKIHLRGKVLNGRMVVSPALRQSWKEKHAERSLELPLQSSSAEKLTISVHVEVGRTSIKPSEWKTVQLGDFVFLDSCTIKPNDEKGGRVTLTVNGMPFYIGKIKDGNIKILDHPLYHTYEEEDTIMTNPSAENPQKGTPEEHEDESSFDFDLESEMDSELESEPEETSELESEAEGSTEEEPVSEEETAAEPKMEFTEEETAPAAQLNIEEIPLSVVIEVGRLQMSVKKILELQPGNLLELDLHPENGVDLVVNGKRIAKGELVKLGEALGVRILDIG